jgi:membrane protein YdbS with pleckstrin-like domain
MHADPLPDPSQRLAPAARGLWRTVGAMWSAFVLFAAAMTSDAISGWDERPGIAAPALWVLAALLCVVLVVVVPELRWRRWRYEIRPAEIDIRHGAWTVTRTLVPMARVQHVDTESGLLQQGFGLATVAFHTAAGRTEIPQLAEAEAAAVRERIAQLARVAEADV